MSFDVTPLSGNDWQEWADQLLILHYGPTEYQKISAKHGGDAGIEGFTITKGHAYQCYGCDEPVSIEARYESQRNKMTRDLGKFITNVKKLHDLFGSTLISRWCLLVPKHDSRLIVEHATAKTAEVKAANLPYVATDFRVMVIEERDFAKERDQLTALRPSGIEVTGTQVSDTDAGVWLSEAKNDSLVTSLDEKVSRLPTIMKESRRLEFRGQLIKHFLDGQNVLKALQDTYPISFERVVKLKFGKERYLKSASMVATGNPAEILTSTLQQLRNAFEEGCGVVPSTAEALTWEAIADWLLRCPLDFPDEVME